jgi:hypothetical protein
MRRLLATTLIGLLDYGHARLLSAASTQFDCPVTQAATELPDVGLVPGRSPIWFADGSTGAWRERQPTKSLWVLSRMAKGRLRIEGRRLDGPGLVEFARDFGGPFLPTLEILDPWHGSIIGTRREITQAYAFVPSYVMYPSPGCWQLTAILGDNRVTFARELDAR